MHITLRRTKKAVFAHLTLKRKFCTEIQSLYISLSGVRFVLHMAVFVHLTLKHTFVLYMTVFVHCSLTLRRTFCAEKINVHLTLRRTFCAAHGVRCAKTTILYSTKCTLDNEMYKNFHIQYKN